jgi:ribose transport system permease protein
MILGSISDIKLKSFVALHKNVIIGSSLLLFLFIVGTFAVEGFNSAMNIKSMLLLASFLGMASLGQTLCALLGALDLAIPFIIGAANIGLASIINLGIPPWMAALIVLFVGSLIGALNGILSFRLQGQALIMTLGVGFATVGGVQILTSIGSVYGGNVFGNIPDWLTNIASINGTTFGIGIPPVIIIWLWVTLVVILFMGNTQYGRNFYALGGNRTASKRLSISEFKLWVSAYVVSGGMAAITGMLLLGFSGGGFVGVGDPYLFTTLAAVVIGGTSLLGGWGGYGSTVFGVLVLTVLTSLLVGLGFSYAAQQSVIGLIIIPMVALYARSPHIRMQI